MNIFLLSLSRVSREFFDAIDTIHHVSLILLWRFQGPKWLCFRWRFLVSSDVVISDDSMRQRWLFSLLISFVNRELACVVDSVRQPWLSFKHDFSFYSDSVFADYFWISTGIVCLTIPCVKQESIFAIGFTRRREFFDGVDFIRQLPLIFQWRFQGLQWLCFRWRFLVSVDAVSLAIPWVNDDPVLSFDFVPQPWISMRCRFHPSAVTQFERWFLILQWLSFRCRFLDQHWHSVFEDSMHQTWIYFCFRFLAVVVNSLTLSTPYVSCFSYYSGDFRV